MRALRAFLLVGVAALAMGAVACKDSTSPAKPTVTGHWLGTIIATGQSGTISITLAESNTAVTGSGSLQGPGGTLAWTVTGTDVYPNVSLTLTATGFNPANFTGTLNSAGTSMVGTLNGSGWTNLAITFVKQ